MNRNSKKILRVFALAAVFFAGGSAAADLSFSASADHDNALYNIKEKIVFKVSLLTENGKQLPGQTIHYVIQGDGTLKRSGSVVSGDTPVEILTALDRPGFVLLTASVTAGKRNYRTWAGAGVDVSNIRAATPEIPDFDTFWEKQLKELRSRKYTIARNRVDDPGIRHGAKVYDVRLDDGKLRANGYLIMPPDAEKGRHPIIISFNGASKIGAFYQSQDNVAYSYRAIVFNMNLHDTICGPTEAQVRKFRQAPEIDKYMYRDADSPENYRVRSIFLRAVRCLDYLKSLPEWDGRTIVTRGGSFGGALSLAAAYFEPLTKLCVANVPAMSDHYGADFKQSPGWPDIFQYLASNEQLALESARRSMVYFDSVNFARRLKCPIAMSVGFIDTVCPPTSVYAVYNSLGSKRKSIENITLGRHGVSLKPGEKSVFSCGGWQIQDVCRQAAREIR